MKYRFSQRGASAVEFALILPLLLAIVFGIIEFGAVLYNQAVITNASREGARYAAGFYTNPATATKGRPHCSDIQNYVVNYVNKRFIGFVSTPDFAANNVKCCQNNVCTTSNDPSYNYSGTDVGYVDTIRIEYQYGFLVVGNLIHLLDLLARGTSAPWPSSWTLAAQTSMRDENQQ
jgi:Flp pilus assembly protein TadG